jgi:hypothetical protein
VASTVVQLATQKLTIDSLYAVAIRNKPG